MGAHLSVLDVAPAPTRAVRRPEVRTPRAARADNAARDGVPEPGGRERCFGERRR
ncbi:hypothetical protein [Streptomyces aureocirculatus]|uniref:hypothetical protein n=1 Tax=Streptomyces aureocirculatus TaxID=67275 RepID=UPI000AE2FFF6|nr:hypothetical protein [Streptomyces aureocirculatus]